MNDILKEFKINPSADIGELQSLRVSLNDKRNIVVVICVAFLALVVAACIFMLYLEAPRAVLMSLILLLAACFAFYLYKPDWFKRRHYVGVTGMNGCALYRIYKKDKIALPSRVFLFKDMDSLILSQTDNYTNGIYAGTSVRFELRRGGAAIYKTRCNYLNRKKKERQYGWKFLFLTDVEDAWTSYLISHLNRDLNAKGRLVFDTGKAVVTIGNGYVDHHGVTFRQDEIKRMWTDDGYLLIEHNNYDRKFLGLKPKGHRMAIRINEMPNRKAFLLSMQTLLQVN